MKKKVLLLLAVSVISLTGCTAEQINDVGAALQEVEQEDIDNIESKAGEAVDSLIDSTNKALDYLKESTDSSESEEATQSEE